MKIWMEIKYIVKSCHTDIYMKMPRTLDIETAKEMIMDELNQLQEEKKKPLIKFKDIYRNNRQWSSIFFKAGKELDRMNENIDMSVKSGFHQLELSN
jgi:urocanate hydratase